MNATKQYTRDVILSMLAYTVVLIISILIVKRLEDGSPLEYLIVVLPVIPVLFGMRAVTTYFAKLDELERKIHFEGFVFSFAITGIVTFTYGFLQIVGMPEIGMMWVFPLMIALWGIGQFLARRKYQ